MKRIVNILLIGILCFAMCGCTNNAVKDKINELEQICKKNDVIYKVEENEKVIHFVLEDFFDEERRDEVFNGALSIMANRSEIIEHGMDNDGVTYNIYKDGGVFKAVIDLSGMVTIYYGTKDAVSLNLD